MEGRVIERRQQRRVDLEVPIEIRGLTMQGPPSESLTGRARNINLAGCFALMPASFSWPAGSPVSFTMTIPQELTKEFPFVRLVGRGWIVRVTAPTRQRRVSDQPAAEPEWARGEAKGGEPEVGVAIAFSSDVLPLTTIGGY